MAIIVAGRSSKVAAMAGMRLPIESHVLQAYVTEGLKPCIDHVISYGMGHIYINQSDIEWLFVDCGLCYGGFKAVPGSGHVMAHLMATGEHHAAATKFRLDRFRTGQNLMDEEGTGSQHNLH